MAVDGFYMIIVGNVTVFAVFWAWLATMLLNTGSADKDQVSRGKHVFLQLLA